MADFQKQGMNDNTLKNGVGMIIQSKRRVLMVLAVIIMTYCKLIAFSFAATFDFCSRSKTILSETDFIILTTLTLSYTLPPVRTQIEHSPNGQSAFVQILCRYPAQTQLLHQPSFLKVLHRNI